MAVNNVAAPRDPAQAAPTEEKKQQNDAEIRAAAKQFEGVMLSQLFSVMRQTMSPDGQGLFSGSGGEIYAEMMDKEMGDAMAESGGFGLADVLARAMGASEKSGSSVTHTAMLPTLPPNLGPIVDARPSSGADLGGATGRLQQIADALLPESGVARQWGREGTLTEADLASRFQTVSERGAANFNVRDANGYRGSYKCNLFAMELVRRAGFQTPVQAVGRGWGYLTTSQLTEDASDGTVQGGWARVVSRASADAIDSSIVRGDSAFLVTSSGTEGHHGHMGVIERVHSITRDESGEISQIVFDGWEARQSGARHLERRTWNVKGHFGGNDVRGGLGRIEILELRTARPGEAPERPLHSPEHVRTSVRDGSRDDDNRTMEGTES